MKQVKTHSKMSLTIFICVMLVSTPGALLSQDSAVMKIEPTKTPPTMPVLYRSFLAYQLHLERKADALKQAGKNGEDFRTRYQKRLGFSDQEALQLHNAALRLEKVLQEKDSEAKLLILTARAANPKGPLPTGWVLPPPPPRLKELQAERETAIDAEIASLRKSLNASDVLKLESFLQNDFAPAVTMGAPIPYYSPHSPLDSGGKR